MKRVSSHRLKVPLRKPRYLPTKENKYVWLDTKRHYRDKEDNEIKQTPFLNKEALKKFISTFNLGRSKQTETTSIYNLNKYFDLDPRGFRKFAINFDLYNEYKNISAEEIEENVLQDIGIYINNDPNTFTKTQKLDIPPEEFEHPDDMPPIDKGLDEIGITKADFKI